MEIDGHTIDLSNQDKVFYPDDELTKGDVVEYYHAVADTMLVHLREHPVSMERFPDGIDEGGFFNKQTPDHFPDWIDRVDFPRREGGRFQAPVVDSAAGLVYLADQAVLTPHLYLAQADDLERPDRMIFDLDPDEDDGQDEAVRRAALELHEVLDALGLTSWIQTTGSKGFHVIVALDRSADFDESRRFARDVARLVVRRAEDRYTLEQRKDQRQGRIFVDTLRNAYGATAVCPYALRARPGAPVATPVEWSEVEDGASPRDWTLKDVPRRLGQKSDPWKDLSRYGVSLAAHREALDQAMDRSRSAEEEQE